MKKEDSSQETQKQKLKVKYEVTTAQYANQFLINTTTEELFLDLSSGAVTDPQTGDSVVPIHSRVAMSYKGARRLSQLLAQAVQRHEASVGKSSGATSQSSARLPKVDN